MTIAVIATLKVAAGKGPDLEKAMGNLIAQVRANEPGNQLYTLVKDKEGNYLMLELYADQAALDAHGASAHFKAAGPSFAGIMAGAPDVKVYEVIA
ncbi:MAG: putative quinol monooxygenase [Pseudomonadales bacterium]